MKPALSKTELPPSTQLRKAVFGGSLLSGKSFLRVLAICAVTILFLDRNVGRGCPVGDRVQADDPIRAGGDQGGHSRRQSAHQGQG
jgi:hypothetical protein